MTDSHPEILIHDDRSRLRALEILRNRMFGGSNSLQLKSNRPFYWCKSLTRITLCWFPVNVDL